VFTVEHYIPTKLHADKAGVNVGQSLFTDTGYADDAVLFAEDDVQWLSILESFDTAANTMGLTHTGQKLKFKFDLYHLPVSHKDIK